MKKLFVLALAAAVTPMAAARVWTSVYRYDGRTPVKCIDPNHPDAYGDVMVGTRLTLVVSSDASDYWLGSLLLSWDDAQHAKLSGRGYTAPPPGSPIKFATYRDSCLDAAGTKAIVRDLADSEGIGLSLSNCITPYVSGGHPAYPGDWFVVDYHAEQVGNCDVGLYDLFASDDMPMEMISFTHVPSRDFNTDTVVNFKDFALLASHWRSAIDPNSSGEAAVDLKADRRVDVSDLMSFSRYWLEQTDCSDAPTQSATVTKP